MKHLLLSLTLLLSITVSSQTLINGLYYKNFDLSTKTCALTYGTTKYTGSITIPSSVTYRGSSYSVAAVGDSAFYRCTDLTSVKIPNTVTSIDSCAFMYCPTLKSITIPYGVTIIRYYAFAYCSGLKSITIPNSVTSIGNYAFSDCTSLTSVTIPDKVKSIGTAAFAVCSSLTSITIPNSVTSIGYFAFQSCKCLTSVTIPNSVKSIDFRAFAYCSQLGHVYCYAENIPRTDNNAFVGSSIEYVTLHVPSAVIDDYKTTEPWSGFGAFEELPMPKCATPTINYVDGRLTFSCETEGATFGYSVTTPSVINTKDTDVAMPKKYRVSVYAMADGYQRSATATKDIEVSGTTGIKGDVNEDGQVNGTDIQEVINIIVEGE